MVGQTVGDRCPTLHGPGYQFPDHAAETAFAFRTTRRRSTVSRGALHLQYRVGEWDGVSKQQQAASRCARYSTGLGFVSVATLAQRRACGGFGGLPTSVDFSLGAWEVFAIFSTGRTV